MIVTEGEEGGRQRDCEESKEGGNMGGNQRRRSEESYKESVLSFGKKELKRS